MNKICTKCLQEKNIDDFYRIKSEKIASWCKECDKNRKSRLSHILNGMKQRCYNLNHEAYHNYGGRGIKVCKEWLTDSKSFYDWAKQNGYNKNLQIDRIDNNKDYTPFNCRWVTIKQNANNRRTNKFITFDNKTMSYSEWDTELGFRRNTIRERLERGWNIEDVINKPVGKNGRRKNK